MKMTHTKTNYSVTHTLLLLVLAYIHRTTANFSNQCLKAHNEFRKLHFNTPEVSYSGILEDEARKWANQFEVDDSGVKIGPTRPLPRKRRAANIHVEYWDGEITYPLMPESVNYRRKVRVGVSIHKHCCKSQPLCPPDFFHGLNFPPSAEGVVKDFYYQERKHYNYKTGESKDAYGSIRHFTNIVWRNTTKIGCFQSRMSNKECHYTVIFYEKEGSKGGPTAFVENVGRLKSEMEPMDSNGLALVVGLVILFIIVIAVFSILCYIKRDFVQARYVDFKIKKNTLKAEAELRTDRSSTFWWLYVFKRRSRSVHAPPTGRRPSTLPRPPLRPGLKPGVRPSIRVITNDERDGRAPPRPPTQKPIKTNPVWNGTSNSHDSNYPDKPLPPAPAYHNRSYDQTNLPDEDNNIIRPSLHLPLTNDQIGQARANGAPSRPVPSKTVNFSQPSSVTKEEPKKLPLPSIFRQSEPPATPANKPMPKTPLKPVLKPSTTNPNTKTSQPNGFELKPLLKPTNSQNAPVNQPNKTQPGIALKPTLSNKPSHPTVNAEPSKAALPKPPQDKPKNPMMPKPVLRPVSTPSAAAPKPKHAPRNKTSALDETSEETRPVSELKAALDRINSGADTPPPGRGAKKPLIPPKTRPTSAGRGNDNDNEDSPSKSVSQLKNLLEKKNSR